MTNSTSSRVVGLDVLRILACFLVILYHVSQNVEYQGFVFVDIVSRILNSISFYIGRLGVPLFFIISGYLLMPTKETAQGFYKKRFGRIVIPTILWIGIYALVGSDIKTNDIPMLFIAKSQHLWYMFALIAVYFVIPIISPWFLNAQKKDHLLLLSFWGITLLFPIINCYTPITIDYSHQGQLYYTPFHSFYYLSGYIGYTYVGALIKKHNDDIFQHRIYYIMPLFLIAILILAVSMFVLKVPDHEAMAYLSLPNALISTALVLLFTGGGGKFTITETLSVRKQEVISKVSKLTYGVYLIHVLVLEQVKIEFLGGYTRWAIAIFVFIISLLIVKLLSFIPYSKYIIG